MYRALLILAVFATGCTLQPATFTWYHPMGGEYLFAYDQGECEAEATGQGTDLGTDIEGPFFQCMHQRGYFLVGANGVVQEPPPSVAAAQQQVSQQ